MLMCHIFIRLFRVLLSHTQTVHLSAAAIIIVDHIADISKEILLTIKGFTRFVFVKPLLVLLESFIGSFSPDLLWLLFMVS